MLYQWTSAVIGLFTGGLIIYLVRKDRLRTNYAVSWLTVAVAIILIALKPRLVDAVGIFLGVHYPPVLIIILGYGFLLIKILTMDIDRSRQEIKLRRLTQKIAILEAMLEQQSGSRYEK